MFYLLIYDIDTKFSKSSKLHKVAKICEDYGIRVQNSVFELNLTPKDMLLLKNKLTKVIDPTIDSIRIYKLGKDYDDVELLGKRETFEATKDSGLII